MICVQHWSLLITINEQWKVQRSMLAQMTIVSSSLVQISLRPVDEAPIIWYSSTKAMIIAVGLLNGGEALIL